MRSSHLIALAASAALAAPVLTLAPSEAEAAPSKPALVEHFQAHAPTPTTTTTRDDATRYAAAEKNAPDASKFSGGSAVIIIGPTLLVLLLILLILI